MNTSHKLTESDIARELAVRAHANQRYGSRPYIDHLQEVVSVVREFGFNDEDLLAAAWLHDLKEDQPQFIIDMTFSGLPKNVIAIVDAVTDEQGKNRKERKQKTYPKIRALFGALVVKLADRIANVRASKANNPELFRMYQREHCEFKRALETNNVRLFPMWEELDCLLA